MTPDRPGLWLYSDPNAAPRVVEVVLAGEALCARFKDEDGDELIPVSDMAGSWGQAPNALSLELYRTRLG